jgi:four helix bundle protein
MTERLQTSTYYFSTPNLDMMAAINRLEDFEVWQSARELAREVYALPESHPAKRDFAFRDQLCRASISTMSNAAEAYGRSSDPDKARFLDFSRGSANETLSMFYLGSDIGHFTQQEADAFMSINRKILKQLTQLIKYLRTSVPR